MTIEQLGKTKLLISLCSQDMKDFSLRFDTMSLWDDHSRKVLWRLLHLASSKTGIPMDESCVLVEAVPFDSGCVLLVSLIDKGDRRKTYRAVKPKGRPCVMFCTSTELLSCAEMVYRQEMPLHKNSLWLFEDRYYLLFDYPCISQKAKGLLGEFGKVFLANDRKVATLKEAGKALCEGDAMNTVGRVVCK